MRKIKACFAKVLVSLCLLAVLFGVVPIQAYAFTIHVDNPYSQKLYLAFIHWDDSEQSWYCHGWQSVEPRSSKNIDISDSNANRVYIYSYNSEASFGGDGYAGSSPHYVINDVFGYYDNGSCPAGKNRRLVYFSKWEIVDGYVAYAP